MKSTVTSVTYLYLMISWLIEVVSLSLVLDLYF